MAEKIFGIFDKRPLIWAHYLPLTIVVLAFLKFMSINIANMDWKFVLTLYLAISLSDQIVHKISNVD